MKVREILENRTVWMPSVDYEKTKPLVSVLLPTWKRAKNGLFAAAVKSVLNQTLENLELIIVDDCSTDGTFDIIKNFMKKDSRISCIRHTENIGLPAISEFEAYQKSRGSYIAFIFDDNEWELDALEQLVDYAQKHDIMALAGQYRLFVGKPGSSYDAPENWKKLGGENVNISDLMITNCFGNGSVLLHRDTVETVGFLDPNIALSRHCDWDLWQRISDKFCFEMIDVMVGSEKGAGLEDSLGNTHQLYQWAAQERMHQPRNQELLPKNYMECDIFEFTLNSSQFLYRSNCWIAKQYENKPWFNDKDVSLCNIQEKSTREWNGKRIVYLNSYFQVNASATLNWGRLPYSEEYVIYYSNIYNYDYDNWVLADAIVIERELSSVIDPILDWAKRMGIPCYYYVDDNFTALVNDYAETYLYNNMKRLANGSNKESLSRFHGIFCSTIALKEYFQKHLLHQNISLMEPIYKEEYVQPYHEMKETVNIVFFGSDIRGEVLISTVYPALKKIAETQDVHLFCPGETFIKLKESIYKNNATFKDHFRKKIDGMTDTESLESIQICEHFVLHGFPRTLSLELALKRLEKAEINIQIHCGPIIENARYKTVNALLNAVCLGSVLVASDDFPYAAINSDEPTCVLAENTVHGWENALRKAINSQAHIILYKNAKTYCQKEFDANKGKNNLIAATQSISSYNMLDLNKRLLSYIQNLHGLYGKILDKTMNDVSAKDKIWKEMVDIASLPSNELKKKLQTIIPNWIPGGSGIEKLFPIGLSQAITCDTYISIKLPRAKSIKLVLIAVGTCPILFELVSENKIIKQEKVEMIGICQQIITVPYSPSTVYLRIANLHPSSSVYVLQRHFLSKTIFDVSVDEKEED